MSVIEKSVEAKCILASAIIELSDYIIRDFHEALPFDFDVYNAQRQRVACANYYAGARDEQAAEAEWHINFLNGLSFAITLEPDGEWLMSTPNGQMPLSIENVCTVLSDSGALSENVLVHPLIAKWRSNCHTAGIDSRLYRIP